MKGKNKIKRKTLSVLSYTEINDAREFVMNVNDEMKECKLVR